MAAKVVPLSVLPALQEIDRHADGVSSHLEAFHLAVAGAHTASPLSIETVARASLGAAGGGLAGGTIWVVATFFLGQSPWLGGYVAALAVLVGIGAGYGALLASERARGPAIQAISVAATLVLLVGFQWLVVRIHLGWLETALAEIGKAMAHPVSWWDMVIEGFLGTYFFDLKALTKLGDGGGVVPGLIFWAIAIANAVAIPRQYKYGEDGRV